jgi:uncharacterized protein YkwD
MRITFSLLSILCLTAACGGENAPTTESDTTLPNTSAETNTGTIGGSTDENAQSGGETTSPPKEEEETSTPPVADSTTLPGTTEGGRFLDLINHLRQTGSFCGGIWYGPVGPVQWDRKLEKAAYGHAADMVRLSFFSHYSLDGRTFSTRIKATGFLYSTIGENIAYRNDTTAEGVLGAWIRSSGHCKVMMNGKYDRIGLGFDITSKGRVYWVLDLGKIKL